MRALLAALLLVAASGAWAQGYVGAAIGESKLGGFDDTASRVFGGYQFTPTFAMEAGYQDLGSVTASGHAATVTAFDFSFLGSWELGNRFALLGRIGAYRSSISGAGTNLGPVFGLGMSYELTHSAAFRLEWQRFYDLGTDINPKHDIDVLSIGAVYRF